MQDHENSRSSKRNSFSSPPREQSIHIPKTKIDLKIVIMGHGGVGKTSFINRYINNNFTETTIGASFVLKKWKNFYLGIWDTAGQERFTRISNYYCRGAQAAILAYDITDRETFLSLESYRKHLKEAEPDCFVVVIGTKSDLISSSLKNSNKVEGEEHKDNTSKDYKVREVPYEEGVEYANSIKAVFFETSAKNNINVTSAFDRIAYQCLASRLAAAGDGDGSGMEGSMINTTSGSPKQQQTTTINTKTERPSPVPSTACKCCIM